MLLNLSITSIFTAYQQKPNVSNTRLVWRVGIVLFSPLSGDYTSQRKNVYLGTGCICSKSKQNKCLLHIEALAYSSWDIQPHSEAVSVLTTTQGEHFYTTLLPSPE